MALVAKVWKEPWSTLKLFSFTRKHNTFLPENTTHFLDQSLANNNMASKTQLGTEIAALQDTCLTNCIFLQKKTTAQLDWQDHIALDLRVDSCGNELLPRLDETNCHFPGPLPKREQTLLLPTNNPKFTKLALF